MQFDVKFNPATGEYTRPTLDLCYQKPIPNPPYVENGIVTLTLAEHTDLKALIEQATGLAVPIAIDKIFNPPTPPEPVVTEE